LKEGWRKRVKYKNLRMEFPRLDGGLKSITLKRLGWEPGKRFMDSRKEAWIKA